MYADRKQSGLVYCKETTNSCLLLKSKPRCFVLYVPFCGSLLYVSHHGSFQARVPWVHSDHDPDQRLQLRSGGYLPTLGVCWLGLPNTAKGDVKWCQGESKIHLERKLQSILKGQSDRIGPMSLPHFTSSAVYAQKAKVFRCCKT